MAALFAMVQDDHPPLPDNISHALKEFLLLCFDKDPVIRTPAAELLNHVWLQQAAMTFKGTSTGMGTGIGTGVGRISAGIGKDESDKSIASISDQTFESRETPSETSKHSYNQSTAIIKEKEKEKESIKIIDKKINSSKIEYIVGIEVGISDVKDTTKDTKSTIIIDTTQEVRPVLERSLKGMNSSVDQTDGLKTSPRTVDHWHSAEQEARELAALELLKKEKEREKLESEKSEISNTKPYYKNSSSISSRDISISSRDISKDSKDTYYKKISISNLAATAVGDIHQPSGLDNLSMKRDGSCMISSDEAEEYEKSLPDSQSLLIDLKSNASSRTPQSPLAMRPSPIATTTTTTATTSNSTTPTSASSMRPKMVRLKSFELPADTQNIRASLNWNSKSTSKSPKNIGGIVVGGFNNDNNDSTNNSNDIDKHNDNNNDSNNDLNISNLNHTDSDSALKISSSLSGISDDGYGYNDGDGKYSGLRFASSQSSQLSELGHSEVGQMEVGPTMSMSRSDSSSLKHLAISRSKVASGAGGDSGGSVGGVVERGDSVGKNLPASQLTSLFASSSSSYHPSDDDEDDDDESETTIHTAKTLHLLSKFPSRPDSYKVLNTDTSDENENKINLDREDKINLEFTAALMASFKEDPNEDEGIFDDLRLSLGHDVNVHEKKGKGMELLRETLKNNKLMLNVNVNMPASVSALNTCSTRGSDRISSNSSSSRSSFNNSSSRSSFTNKSNLDIWIENERDTSSKNNQNNDINDIKDNKNGGSDSDSSSDSDDSETFSGLNMTASELRLRVRLGLESAENSSDPYDNMPEVRRKRNLMMAYICYSIIYYYNLFVVLIIWSFLLLILKYFF